MRKPLSERLPVPRQRRQSEPLKLPLWTLHFGAWLVACPYTPSKLEQCHVATEIANKLRHTSQRPVKITYPQIKHYRGVPEWQDYVRALEAGGIEAARQMFVSDLPAYMELHRWGAHAAKAANDYKAIPAFTVPALDRAVPKRAEGAPAAQVAIVLSSAQVAGLRAYPEVEVEAEVLPPASNEANAD